MKKEKEIGLIGFGNFGKFIVLHLHHFFKIAVYDPQLQEQISDFPDVKQATFQEAASREIVIVAVPVQFLENLLRVMSPLVIPGALLVDVSSVKVKPVLWMKTLLPDTVEVLGTHPLFGPNSGRDGIKGFRIVVCPTGGERTPWVVKFLEEVLHLQVFIRTPEEHDREMAWVQALPHFIGKGLTQIGVQASEQSTLAYEYLLRFHDIIKDDSDALFATIQQENPFAAEIRQRFTDILGEISENLTHPPTGTANS
ncbi:MAG: prephenate dehydrogenase [Blastocatellia bacterium]|nr:prephenate dehydrogenase [Blastocatellia bacterium]